MAATADEKQQAICLEVSRHWDDGEEHVREYCEEFEDNYRFAFKFDHYDDQNANQRDRRRFKPKSRQLASKLRRVVATVVRQLRGLSVRPTEDVADAQVAEDARWFMEYETKDPRKRFKQHLYDAVYLACGANLGALELTVRYDLGPYPEVRPRLRDPRTVKWTPGWRDPTDDTCPWVVFEDWMLPEDIEREPGWKNNKNVQDESPDSGRPAQPTPLRPLANLSDSGPNPGHVFSSRMVRVLRCYYRFAEDTRQRDTGDETLLDPSQRYLACPECGHEDRSHEGALIEEDGAVPNADRMIGPALIFCPKCRAAGVEQPLRRVTRIAATETVLAYPQRHRLVICAPQVNRVFYDDGWPYQLNGRPPRNVPLAWFQRYRLPLEPWGTCDTTWDWSYVVIQNACNRRGYEFVSQAGGVIVTSGDGLWNPDGKTRFAFSDRPLSIAHWKGMGAPGVEYFQPRGMLGELMPYAQNIGSELRTDAGIADLALSDRNSKDIPASTVAQLEASGEIPQDDFAERCADELSNFLGVWYDTKRAIMTERQIAGLRSADGAEFFARLRGEDLPNVDVVVEVMPSWREFDAERQRHLTTLLQWPPKLWPLLMRAAGVPPSFIREAQFLLTQLSPEEQAQLAAMPRAASAPGSGVAGMGPAQMYQGALT